MEFDRIKVNNGEIHEKNDSRSSDLGHVYAHVKYMCVGGCIKYNKIQ